MTSPQASSIRPPLRCRVRTTAHIRIKLRLKPLWARRVPPAHFRSATSLELVRASEGLQKTYKTNWFLSRSTFVAHRVSNNHQHPLNKYVLSVSSDVRHGSLAASPRSTRKQRKSSTIIGHMCKQWFCRAACLRAFVGQSAAPKVTTNQPCHVKAFIGPTGAQMTPTECQI